MNTDSEIIRRSLERPFIFGELYDRHAPTIYRYAARRAGNYAADDVVSETFLVAFERRETFDSARDDARPWLFGIATNLLRRHHRAEAKTLRLLAKTAQREEMPEQFSRIADQVDAQALVGRIAKKLKSMASIDRETILLYAWADLTYEGIALAMGVPVGTVRSRMNRARRALKNELGFSPWMRWRWIMDDLQLLREIRNDVGTAAEESLANGRQTLMARIGTETAGTALSSKTPRRTMLRRGFLVWAAAAVLVGGIVVADVVSIGGTPGATAEAAQVLDNAAAATIKTSDPVVGPSQYLKIATTAQYSSTNIDAAGKTTAWLDLMTHEMYIPTNRNNEWVWNRSARVPTTFFDEASKEKALADYAASTQNGPTGELLRGPKGNFYGTPAEDVAATTASLPREPQALLDAIYNQAGDKGPSRDGEALVIIADLLRTGQVQAEMRAALYKAAALIPGITIAEQQATLNGKTGIAIGRIEPKDKIRQDIIIDPGTGLMIGERQVLTEGDGLIPAGTAIGWTVVETSVVDSAP